MVDNADDNLDLSGNSSDEQDIRERNLYLQREAHARREGESVLLFCMIAPHPTPVAIRNNKLRKGKKEHKERKPKKHCRTKSPTRDTSLFCIVNQEYQFK